MTTDERIQRRLEAQGVDIQSDEGARQFQDELDRALDAERRQVRSLRAEKVGRFTV
jgi:hypothetical protein